MTKELTTAETKRLKELTTESTENTEKFSCRACFLVYRCSMTVMLPPPSAPSVILSGFNNYNILQPLEDVGDLICICFIFIVKNAWCEDFESTFFGGF